MLADSTPVDSMVDNSMFDDPVGSGGSIRDDDSIVIDGSTSDDTCIVCQCF